MRHALNFYIFISFKMFDASSLFVGKLISSWSCLHSQRLSWYNVTTTNKCSNNEYTIKKYLDHLCVNRIRVMFSANFSAGFSALYLRFSSYWTVLVDVYARKTTIQAFGLTFLWNWVKGFILSSYSLPYLSDGSSTLMDDRLKFLVLALGSEDESMFNATERF